MYHFDTFTLDLPAGELRASGQAIPTDQMTFSLLAYLVENAERLVSKDELVEKVWNGKFISDAAISSAVRSVRKAIGDSGSAQRLVRTVHGRGFRFVGEVRVSLGDLAVPAAALPVAGTLHDTTALPPGERPSIAILPFSRIGDESTFAAIADAVPAEIITTLSRLRWLKVIARGSSFRFRADTPNIEDIRAALGVGYVVSGAVEIFGTTVALTVEVTDAHKGHVLWADRLSGPIADIHEMRERIVVLVTSALEMHIPQNEAELARLRGPDAIDAWAFYHTGLQHMYRFNQTDNALADGYFRRALELDPNFARAHGARSFTSFQAAFLRYGSDRERAIADARRHAERGVELDPVDPFVSFNLGRVHWLLGDPKAGQGWIERATALSPSFAQGHYAHGWANVMSGNGTDAISDLDAAITLSPLDPFLYAMESAMGLAHFHVDDLGAAADWGIRGARKPGAHYLIAAIASALSEIAGLREDALYWAEQTRSRRPDASIAQFFAAFPFEDHAKRAELQRALATLGFPSGV